MLFYKDDFVQIHHGNALNILKELPDESVQCVITSPPYWGLRNYAGGADIVWGNNNCDHKWGDLIPSRGQSNWHTFTKQYHSPDSHKTTIGASMKPKAEQNNGHGNFCIKCGAWHGQLGLEPAPELYVEHLMMIFQEIKRVLRKDGCFFLNIGDTYVSGKGSCFNPGGGDRSWKSWVDQKVKYPTGRDAPSRMCKTIPPKCMACVPERVLFVMLADGWILRNKIIWHKTNHMPGSQKDRFSQSWEYLYFFTKSRTYYFDLDAVRVPHKTESLERYQRGVNLGRPAEGKSGVVGPMQQYTRAPEQEVKDYDYPEKHHGSPMTNQLRLYRDRQQKHENADLGAQKPARMKHSGYYGQNGEPLVNFAKGKNPSDLWSISTKPSSISVCPQCETVFPRLLKVCPHCKVEGIVGHFAPYPEALCVDPIKACSRVGDTIIDPFAGGGTTGVAAKKLGRRSILIDCVRVYCVMAKYKSQRVVYQPGMEANNV